MKLSIQWSNRVRSIVALALATILAAGSLVPSVATRRLPPLRFARRAVL